MLYPRLRTFSPKSIDSRARCCPTIREREATSAVVPNRNRFGSHGDCSSSGVNDLAMDTPRRDDSTRTSLYPEIHPAVPQLLLPPGRKGLRLDEEDPPGLHAPRTGQAAPRLRGALHGELPQVVVRHPDVRQHQLLHLRHRKVLRHAEEVSRLGKLLLLVGARQVLRVLRPFDADVVYGRRGPPGPYKLPHLLRRELAPEGPLPQPLPVRIHVHVPLDLELQGGPVPEDLDEFFQLPFRRRRNGRGARVELDVRKLLAAAPEYRPQECEGGGGGFDQQVPDDLPDDPPYAELRVVGLPGDGKVEVDLPFPVLEKRDGQPDRELRRVGAVHRLAERELVEEDLVLRVELLLLDVVLQAQRQLPLLNAVSCVPAGIGGKRGEVDVPEIGP